MTGKKTKQNAIKRNSRDGHSPKNHRPIKKKKVVQRVTQNVNDKPTKSTLYNVTDLNENKSEKQYNQPITMEDNSDIGSPEIEEIEMLQMTNDLTTKIGQKTTGKNPNEMPMNENNEENEELIFINQSHDYGEMERCCSQQSISSQFSIWSESELNIREVSKSDQKLHNELNHLIEIKELDELEIEKYKVDPMLKKIIKHLFKKIEREKKVYYRLVTDWKYHIVRFPLYHPIEDGYVKMFTEHARFVCKTRTKQVANEYQQDLQCKIFEDSKALKYCKGIYYIDNVALGKIQIQAQFEQLSAITDTKRTNLFRLFLYDTLWGMPFEGTLKDKTVSHLCHNNQCHDESHLVYENKMDNWGRAGCPGPEKGCLHKIKCLIPGPYSHHGKGKLLTKEVSDEIEKIENMTFEKALGKLPSLPWHWYLYQHLQDGKLATKKELMDLLEENGFKRRNIQINWKQNIGKNKHIFAIDHEGKYFLRDEVKHLKKYLIACKFWPMYEPKWVRWYYLAVLINCKEEESRSITRCYGKSYNYTVWNLDIQKIKHFPNFYLSKRNGTEPTLKINYRNSSINIYQNKKKKSDLCGKQAIQIPFIMHQEKGEECSHLSHDWRDFNPYNIVLESGYFNKARMGCPGGDECQHTIKCIIPGPQYRGESSIPNSLHETQH